jgi:hypothetical protein
LQKEHLDSPLDQQKKKEEEEEASLPLRLRPCRSTEILMLTIILPHRFRSTQRLKHLERITRGRVVPGHDEETFLKLQSEKDVFT